MTKTKTAMKSSSKTRLKKKKNITYPHKRFQIRPDKFVRLADFPTDCESKEDECFGHTTEVIRYRIALRQGLAYYRMMYETPATTYPPWTSFDWSTLRSSKDDVLPSEPKSPERTPCGSQYYKYVAGGNRTGS